MRSRWRPDRPSFLAALPAMATAIAEGAWLAVVSAAFASVPGTQSQEPGLLTLAVVAGIGLAIARRGRQLAHWNFVVLFVALVAGGLGWLVDDGARNSLLSGSLVMALAAHPAGWLVGVALWRGTRHGNPADDDLVVGSLLSWGIPGLAVPWALALHNRASNAPFVDAALPASLAFVGAGLLAMGLTRLDALGRRTGVDWRSNRAWAALLGAVVGAMLTIGVPVALFVGASLEGIAHAIAGPIGVIGQPIGTFIGHLLDPILTGLGGLVQAPPQPTAPPTDGGPPSSPGWLLPSLPQWIWTAISLTIAGFLVMLLVAIHRRTAGAPRPVEWRPSAHEERRFVLPSVSLHLPRVSLPQLGPARGPQPRSATGAYRAVLRDWERHAALSRATAESPSAHARRLRSDGTGSVWLDLLAADYQLERYAAVRLTPAESARAIRRWRRLRRPARSSRLWRRAAHAERTG